MTRSLFPDDQKKHRDSGIGGLSANDSLIHSERSALQSLGGTTAVGAGTPRTDIENVFTLRKGNQDYLRGTRERPASNLRFATAISVFALILIAVVPMVILSNQTPIMRNRSNYPPPFFFLIMGGMMLLFLGSLLLTWRNYFFFAKNGQLIMGHLNHASGRWVRSGKNRNYKVTFGYEINTPDGRTIHAEETHSRPDLARRGRMPEVGTPVGVLYVADGDRTYLL